MNLFFNVNKVVGVLFFTTLLSVGAYKGLELGAKARKDAAKMCQKEFERQLRESSKDLPPGLNGEYPADGPMAEFYRNHKGNWTVPVTTQFQFTPPGGYKP